MFRRVVRVMALLFFVGLAVCAVFAFSTQGSSAMQRAGCALAFAVCVVGAGIVIKGFTQAGKEGG